VQSEDRLTIERIELPQRLRGVFFDRIWETSKVWALPTPAELMSFDELRWHLDLTVWTTVRGEARWDLSPSMVLSQPDLHPRRWERILGVDVSFPLEMFRQGNRWVLLDGYHRLARCLVERRSTVAVRLHSDEHWSAIARETSGG